MLHGLLVVRSYYTMKKEWLLLTLYYISCLCLFLPPTLAIHTGF